ncbi:MAG TPA: ATP-binding cassette domain-containing protein [Phytomonospora sp.]
MSDAALVELDGLTVRFGRPRRPWRPRATVTDAVAGVDLRVERGETLALVGESGSGKTTLARCVAGLIGDYRGTFRFDGELVAARSRRRAELRRSIQMVFQDPRSSLTPRMTVGRIVAEGWEAHPSAAPGDEKTALVELLDRVGLDASLIGRRPGELSGGQCQRVSIARALALRPRLLVCDEAVSALDVSVQAQILRLLIDLRGDYDLTILFITHDLGVVRQIADRVAVMRRGEIVETGATAGLYEAPAHPYTRELLDAALDIESEAVN